MLLVKVVCNRLSNSSLMARESSSRPCLPASACAFLPLCRLQRRVNGLAGHWDLHLGDQNQGKTRRKEGREKAETTHVTYYLGLWRCRGWNARAIPPAGRNNQPQLPAGQHVGSSGVNVAVASIRDCAASPVPVEP